MPKLEQERGNTAHAAPCYADKVDPVMLASEQLWQIELRDGLHESYIFPWS